jgi:beta-glucanase (GH16 family)
MASPQAITPASAIAPSSSGSLSVPTGLGTAWLAPYGVGGSWNLILNSTFDGGSLASPWQKGWFGTGITSPVNSLEANCYDPSHVTVADGMLSISATQTPVVCNGVQQPWTSGLINTNGNFSFTYGYMEAMLWLPANPTGKLADWPAFWSDGQNWPTTGEIDTIEGLGGDACWHFHSPYGEPGGCAAGGGFTAGWHILGADWEPGSVTYYYDGVAVGQVTQYVTSAPMYLIIDLASVAGATDNVATTMHVAYVRVWQH